MKDKNAPQATATSVSTAYPEGGKPKKHIRKKKAQRKKASKPLKEKLRKRKKEIQVAAPVAQPAAPPPVPPPKRKIAILGSAVSSVGFAPFDDKTWEIWSCSPANRKIPRCDFWFELHNVELKIREGLTEWMDWLKKQPRIFMQQALPDFPGSISYPLQQMIEKHGRYWWTSQISYMLALAIEQKPAIIGIYGVDMAANAEYSQQRAGCYYFIEQAQKAGIELVVPPESDLLEPPPLYGYCESSRQWRKMYARMQELQGRLSALSNDIAAKEGEKRHLIGAVDDLEYQTAHWANRTDFY